MYKIDRKVNTILTLTEMKYHNQNIELKKNEKAKSTKTAKPHIFSIKIHYIQVVITILIIVVHNTMMTIFLLFRTPFINIALRTT